MAERMAEEGEGFTEKPYHDTVGKMTIGFGRNLDDRGITWTEAKMMLAHDMIEAHNVLHGEFGFFQELPDPRKAVLMDMYHNMGLPRLLGFKKMLRAMMHGQFDTATEELIDSKYYTQTGRRAKRNACMMKFNRFFTAEEAEKKFAEGEQDL